MPFYRRLAQLRATSPQDLGIIAYVPDSERRQDEVATLDANGVGVDSVGAVNFGKIGVPGTPTVFLLDGRGYLKKAWIGLLAGDRQRELLVAVKQLCLACTGV